MPPQNNNQPETLKPTPQAISPEAPAPLSAAEALERQGAATQQNEQNAVEALRVQLSQPASALNIAEAPKPGEAPVSQVLTEAEPTEPNTPTELVKKFEVIEAMAGEPFAEQEAFKNAQDSYLKSLGEPMDEAA